MVKGINEGKKRTIVIREENTNSIDKRQCQLVSLFRAERGKQQAVRNKKRPHD